LWNTNSGLEKFTLAGHTKPVTRLTFSQDGTRIASYGTGDWRWMAEVKLWDAITGREIAIDGYDEKARGLRLEFSPDGKQFVFCGAGLETLRVLDAATGKQLFAIQAPGEGNWTVAWSPDGSRLASASSYSAQWAPEDSTVKLWDVATGEETVSLKGQWGIPARLAFSRNGERLISAGSIGTVKIWEAPRGNRETDGN
jgi:WD40 repeat protein